MPRPPKPPSNGASIGSASPTDHTTSLQLAAPSTSLHDVAMFSPQRHSLGRAVTVIVGLHALAAIAFGSLAHLDSTIQFPDLVSNDDGDFAVGPYGNRNIGVGLALAASLLARHRMMLMGLMSARFITDVGDFVTALTGGLTAGELVGQLVFFGVLFASELWVLHRLRTNEFAAVE